jgi:hypothetical protein
MVSAGAQDHLAEMDENLVLMMTACARLAADRGEWLDLDDLASELGVDLADEEVTAEP